ncbi:MAG TPA: response regulator [Planctomycetaceae bacterium]|nr:response regulator [Planctomycetaceae bacterium]
MSHNPDTAVASSTPAHVRVLVIDDDPFYQKLLTTVLQKNYLISVAGDGVSGLAKAKEFVPDLAIIDVQMPGLDGLQTLTAIRADSALRALKVIMLTADASRETVFAAVRAGADDYLIKTAFSQEELARKIERLLKWNRQDADSTARSEPHPHEATPRGPHLATGARAMVNSTVPAPDSGEITTPTTPPPPSVDQTHLQEILDSWD